MFLSKWKHTVFLRSIWDDDDFVSQEAVSVLWHLEKFNLLDRKHNRERRTKQDAQNKELLTQKQKL